jgi:hypothetical protein
VTSFAPVASPLVSYFPVASHCINTNCLYCVINSVVGAHRHNAGNVCVPSTCTDEHLDRSSGLHVACNGWLITGKDVIIIDFHCVRTRWSGTSVSLTAGSTTRATIVCRVVRTVHIRLNAPNRIHVIVGIRYGSTIASIAGRRVSALTHLCCRQWIVDTPILRADGIGLDLLHSSKSPAAAATALILHSSSVNAYDDSMYET